MTTEELQAAFDDLQLRFDATAQFILDLQQQLAKEQADHAATRVQRDQFKKGFETQSAAHAAAANRLDRMRKGLPITDDPAPAPTPDDPARAA